MILPNHSISAPTSSYYNSTLGFKYEMFWCRDFTVQRISILISEKIALNRHTEPYTHNIPLKTYTQQRYIPQCYLAHLILRSLKDRSHGAIFSECDCFFLSHAMGCVDVNDTVLIMRLWCISVCDVWHRIWIGCIPILCDCNCDY